MRLPWHRDWSWCWWRCWGHRSWRRCWSWRSWRHWRWCWRWRRILGWPTTLASHALLSLATLQAQTALHLALVVESVTLSMCSFGSGWEICRALSIGHRTLGCADDTLVTNTVCCLAFLARRLSIVTARNWSRCWRCRRGWWWRHRCWHRHGRWSRCWSWWGWRNWRTTHSWV